MKKKILFVGMLALALICVSCKDAYTDPNIDGDDPVPSDTDLDADVFVVDISEETDWNYMAVGKDGSSIFFNVNESTGIPTLLYLKPKKNSDAGATYLFKENGLPDKIIVNGYIVYFGNFNGYKFDIAIIAPSGAIEYQYDIETGINWDAYGEISQSGQAQSIQAHSFISNLFRNTLDFISNAVSLIEVVIKPSWSNIAESGLLWGASILVDKVFDGLTADVLTGIIHVVGCASGNPIDCVLGFVDVIDILSDIDLNLANQRNPELAQADGVINGGKGDVKVTLSWNNLADVDLHVIDPYNEEIYYFHKSSASGGILDMDNRYGYGPENIFWPAGGAPTGTYKVYVNFYNTGTSGASNRSSNYTVSINAFRNTKTYTGTVTSSSGKVLVATINSNGDITRTVTAEGSSLVIPESRSVLPPKPPPFSN
jgi:hypothetical protein